MSRHPTSEDDRLAEEAARWFLRNNEQGKHGSCSAEFNAWLSSSKRHQDEYARFQRLWGMLEGIKPPRKKRRRTVAALLIFCAASLSGFHYRFVENSEQLTQAGERAEMILADGSRIELDGKTRIRIDHSLFQRRLVLEQGQIFIEVAPGLRPFVVVAGEGETRDVGTRFNVRREDDLVAVSVAEGRVAVSLPAWNLSREIGPGEQLSYRNGGQLSAVHSVAAESVDAWTLGRWQFDNVTLSDVVAQMNRQHQRPVLIDDPRLGAFRVSGVFSASDRNGLLAALTRLYPIKLVETEGGTRMVAR